MTYNNIYRSFTNQTDRLDDDGQPLQENIETYFYTHYDYTQLKFASVGRLEYSKADSENGLAVAGVKYELFGTSDYGTDYDETLVSNGKGTVLFKNLERSVYTLVETAADIDHIIDRTERKVVVDHQGDVLVATIEGYGRQCIDNVPPGELKILRTDSVTGNPFNGADFTLKAQSGLVSPLEAEYGADMTALIFEEAGFRKVGGEYVKPISGNTASDGEYIFKGLPVSSDGTADHILTEDNAEGHKALNENVLIAFADGKAVYSTDDEEDSKRLGYVKFNNDEHKYEAASAEDAEFIDIDNDPDFREKKILIKSWIDAKEADLSDADAMMKIRFNSVTGEVEYYTDAKMINMPVDCSQLFAACVNENFTSLDLSSFSFTHTTTMSLMFDMTGHNITSDNGNDNCDNNKNGININYGSLNTGSKLAKISFPKNMDSGNVTSTYRMFMGCSSLTELDLRGFDSAKVDNMILMFGDCTYLEKLKLGEKCGFNTVTKSRTGSFKQPFYGLIRLKELNGSQYLSLDKISELCNMFEYTGYSVTNNTLVLDLSGLDQKASNITNMFHNCGAYEILLPNLDTTTATAANRVFNNCSSLTRIQVLTTLIQRPTGRCLLQETLLSLRITAT
ncbi:SpaA isopeptide-forming pilin-related protein [Ruminococcus sp.]|uniref:SpaA isopeptide-forming pilin-related protein n=1 Tax=Ruminococcus sp. TaxID=41978 RepID=UPI0025D5D989|nr:SpaA isopeptide-forming pilin-related protein [Ruminococcus sp.]MBQ8967138.1 BspA family leucine-rich repeat surface protein [Ruminococcus sp.]